MSKIKDRTYKDLSHAISKEIGEYAILFGLFNYVGIKEILKVNPPVLTLAFIYLSFMFMKRAFDVFNKRKNADFTDDELKKFTLLFGTYCALILFGVTLIILWNFI